MLWIGKKKHVTRSMSSGYAHIEKVTTLSKKDDEKEASDLLNKACAQVQVRMGCLGPVMPCVRPLLPDHISLWEKKK